MKKQHKTFVLLFIFLAACVSQQVGTATTAITQTPTETSTPAATLTPTPIPLEGRLFFDLNGSGLLDEATFTFDKARFTDKKELYQPDLLAAITSYVESHPDLQDGDVITIEEPGLSGYEICVTSNCTTTDVEGVFSLSYSGTSTLPKLIISDPYAGQPALEMHYINKWIRAVIIPAYEIEGVQIPEQHLNDTEAIPLVDGISAKTGEFNKIGLMQGILTSPFLAEDTESIYCIGMHDHDPRSGPFINYLGTYANNIGYCVNIAGGDAHSGTDFFVPEGTFLVAPAPGLMTNEFLNPDNRARVARLADLGLEIRPEYYMVLIMGHHSRALVEDIPDEGWNDSTGPKVFRGQIILLSGKTGTYNAPHLHFGVCGNLVPGHTESSEYPGFTCWDPYAIEFSQIDVGFPTSGYDIISNWTAFNNPIAP